MKRILALSVVILSFWARAGENVEIAHFREIISPEVGAKICGYDADQTGLIAFGWLFLYWLYKRNLFIRV